MRAPGIYDNINIDEYHAAEGISASGINLILDCPQRYYYEYHQKAAEVDIQKERDKYKLGRAVHMLALEPHKFNETFFLMREKVNLTTKAGKELYAQAELDARGRTILRAGEWEDISFMADAIKAHQIWDHLKDAKVEHSIFFNGGTFDAKLRARPDIFDSRLIIDLKTTESIKNFQRSIYSYGYHRQAAMQIDALKSIDGIERQFAFFVVEKKAPYLTACFALDAVSLMQGRKEYLEGVDTYSTCLMDNEWPGYDANFQLTEMPKWAIKSEE